MARFEKLRNWKENQMIEKTHRLWNQGYNSLEISKKLRQPIEDVQKRIKLIVAAEHAK